MKWTPNCTDVLIYQYCNDIVAQSQNCYQLRDDTILLLYLLTYF